jgi:hypothetical protein
MTTSQQLPEKPVVFILNLDEEQMFEGLFDSIYSDLIYSLAAKYRLKRARKLGAAQRFLSNAANRPIAILLPDPAVTMEQNSTVLALVTSYAQAGGVVIFAATFSGFITPHAMNKFWDESWGLGWKFGEYYRTDVYLNRYFSSKYLDLLFAKKR